MHPKKSLGQNFLIDKNISKKILKLVDNYENKNIIEIGPGTGALTEHIINKKPKKLILIEKDKMLFNKLLTKYKNFKSIEIYNEDALKYDFTKIKKPKSIIANLPYNISIKLLISWLKQISDFKEIVVMIQKEVAQKMNYNINDKLNRLSFLISISCNYKIEFHVSKNVFFPKPKVDSSVIKLLKKNNIKLDFSKLENFTRLLFRNKRKKIKNVLPIQIINILKQNNISYDFNEILNSRAEDLKIEIITKLFKEFLKI